MGEKEYRTACSQIEQCISWYREQSQRDDLPLQKRVEYIEMADVIEMEYEHLQRQHRLRRKGE